MSSAAQISRDILARFKRMVEDDGVPVTGSFAFGHKYDSAFWISVRTDAERDRLAADTALLARMRGAFADTGYQALIEDIWDKDVRLPALEYLKTLHIRFESEETVARDFGGNWYHAMK